MKKVLINGITGKMGAEVVKVLSSSDEFEVVGGIGRGETDIAKVFPDFDAIDEKVDVIIDFSTHEASIKALEYAKEKGIPMVIATTGFNEEELKTIEEYSKLIPVFKSSNMSYEINLMCEVVSMLASKLKNSDIEIVETHHNRKIDSPSGTALMLADSINEKMNNKYEYVYERHSKKEKRSENEIGIHSIRGGNEVGKHSVFFFGDNESFEITHNVGSRSIFAKGAVEAAKFIIKQGNGLYDMKDLIK